jgi:CBS domain-containing protein
VPKVITRSVITGFKVKEAMRKEIVRCSPETSIDRAIARMVKYKSNALLVESPEHNAEARGIVSKTDLLAAFCASLPLATPVGEIRNAPLLTCLEEDPLEKALGIMAEHDVRRIYVEGETRQWLGGVLGHFDIAGLLYRICRQCKQGAHGLPDEERSVRLNVKDVMTPSIVAHDTDAPLLEVMETLIANRLGAVLIVDSAGLPSGVLSKTDLVLAYRHGLELHRPAGEIMSGSILSVAADEALSEAIKCMVVADVQRVFVHAADASAIVGVLSLTDASRSRSGSCQACKAARLSV